MWKCAVNRTSFLLFLLLWGGLCISKNLQALDNSDKRDFRSKLMSGGETTVINTSREAFAKPAANLPMAKLRDFTFGNRVFNTKWVTAPASVKSFDGLGPLFNQRSCSACHFKDGRGRPPLENETEMTSMLVRVSVWNEDGTQAIDHPVYGNQINERGILNIKGEGRIEITYEEVEGRFADGEVYSLRKPTYHFKDMNYGSVEDDLLFSPRVAPSMFGLGLLEAISEETILAFVDEDDCDGEGISGRANYVEDKVKGEIRLGRFGWKANQPSLRQQNAKAIIGDIGITSDLFPDENVTAIPNAEFVSGGAPELSSKFLDKLTFYVQTLAVPARRKVGDHLVLKGEEIFKKANCHSCHKETLVTGEHEDVPELSRQTIHPYTDLLLHDMGEGLADGRPDGQANGREWRTAPLWGIGLTKTVNKHTFFLHDGRARNLMEALLWHGGEAEAAKQHVLQRDKDDRTALMVFLNSL